MNQEKILKYFKLYNWIAPIYSVTITLIVIIFAYISEVYVVIIDIFFGSLLFLVLFNLIVVVISILYGIIKKQQAITNLGLFALLNQVIIFITLLANFIIGLSHIY